jgi:hypothetical protein
MNRHQFTFGWNCLETMSHTFLTFPTTVYHLQKFAARMRAQNSLLNGSPSIRRYHQHHAVHTWTPIKHFQGMGEDRHTSQAEELLFNAPAHPPSFAGSGYYRHNTHEYSQVK